MPLPSPCAFDKYSWQLSHVVNLDNFAFLAQLYVFSDSHTVWIASQDVELCEVFYQFHHLKEISPWRTFCCVSIWTVFLLCWGTAVTIKTSFTITWEFLLTLVSMYFFLSFLFSSFLAYSFIFFMTLLKFTSSERPSPATLWQIWHIISAQQMFVQWMKHTRGTMW